jgi:hypothetical protein
MLNPISDVESRRGRLAWAGLAASPESGLAGLRIDISPACGVPGKITCRVLPKRLVSISLAQLKMIERS